MTRFSSIPRRTRAVAQNGAALLLAMLIVTLVASFAATVFWKQWRAIEVETAERAREQNSLLLDGGLDFARFILSMDYRSDQRQSRFVDHLDEPWALPLEEAKLATFLAADGGTATISEDMLATRAFMSGQITDLQSRLNITNLGEGTDIAKHQWTAAQFEYLFDQLGLPRAELKLLINAVQQALRADTAENTAGDTPLMPQSLDQLAWLGISQGSIDKLRPYATILPARTTININTADALVLQAAAPGVMDRAMAQKIVNTRLAGGYFTSMANAHQRLGSDIFSADTTHGERFSVSSSFFEVTGFLRIDALTMQERAVLRRDGRNVRIVWRERGALGLGTLNAYNAR